MQIIGYIVPLIGTNPATIAPRPSGALREDGTVVEIPGDMFGDQPAVPVAASAASAVAYHDRWRKLFEDHITWTRVVIMGVFGSLAGTNAYATRLFKNYKDMEGALAPYYSADDVESLGVLLQGHLSIAAAILTALRVGDPNAVKARVVDWYENADQIVAQMAGMNPLWPADENRAMWQQHLDATLTEATANASGSFDAEIEAYDQIHVLALDMADFISNGVIRQQPERFRHDQDAVGDPPPAPPPSQPLPPMPEPAPAPIPAVGEPVAASEAARMREDLYLLGVRQHPDMSEHFPTLRALASAVDDVSEMGTGASAEGAVIPFLAAQPKVLRCYDAGECPGLARLLPIAGRTEVHCTRLDGLFEDIEPTDLLLIDTTPHTYVRLLVELRKQAPHVRRWIVLHETVAWGTRGEDGSCPGLLRAVEEFLAGAPDWRMSWHRETCNGLTLLERVTKD